jgi:hypothetical protein
LVVVVVTSWLLKVLRGCVGKFLLDGMGREAAGVSTRCYNLSMHTLFAMKWLDPSMAPQWAAIAVRAGVILDQPL